MEVPKIRHAGIAALAKLSEDAAHSEITNLIKLARSETDQASRLAPAELLRRLSEPGNAEKLRALFKDFNENVVPHIEIPKNADRDAEIAQQFRGSFFRGILEGADATAFEALLKKPQGNLDVAALADSVAARLDGDPVKKDAIITEIGRLSADTADLQKFKTVEAYREHLDQLGQYLKANGLIPESVDGRAALTDINAIEQAFKKGDPISEAEWKAFRDHHEGQYNEHMLKPEEGKRPGAETIHEPEHVSRQAQLDAKKEINKVLNLLDPRQINNQRELTYALENLDEVLNKYHLVQDIPPNPETTYGEILTRIARLQPISPEELGIVHKGAWDDFTKHAQDLEAQRIANQKAEAEARNGGGVKGALVTAVAGLVKSSPLLFALGGGYFAFQHLFVNDLTVDGTDGGAVQGAARSITEIRGGKPIADGERNALDARKKADQERLNATAAAAQIVGGEATALSSQGMLGRQPPASGAAGTTVTNFKDAWDAIDRASIPADLKGRLKTEWNKINKVSAAGDHDKLEAFTEAARGFVSERYHSDAARKATLRALHLGN